MKILEVRNLEKSFSKKKIIKNLNFYIDEGEVVGFVGSNGAGKTTTFKLLANLIYPDSGEILIGGHNLFTEREKALSNIAAIIENPGIYEYLSGRENINFIGKIRGISKERIDSVIEYVGLKNRIDDKVKSYSLGMKQRLAFGMCILTESKLLILDEPTNGLDPSGMIEFRELIIKLAKEKKISIFFSSHLLTEVNKICDRVIFIKDGEIISVRNYKKNAHGQIYKIYVNNIIKLENVFNKCSFVYNFKSNDGNEIILRIKDGHLPNVLNLLEENNIHFLDVEKCESNIEDEYNEMYGEYL